MNSPLAVPLAGGSVDFQRLWVRSLFRCVETAEDRPKSGRSGIAAEGVLHGFYPGCALFRAARGGRLADELQNASIHRLVAVPVADQLEIGIRGPGLVIGLELDIG